MAESDGQITVDFLKPAAQRILELPLFPGNDGLAVSASRLLRRWIASLQAGVECQPERWLDEKTPSFLTAWLLELLCPEKIIYLPASSKKLGAPKADEIRSHDALALWLTEALASLRVDEMGALNPTKVCFAFSDNGQMKVGGAPIFAMKANQLHLFCHIGGEPVLVVNAHHWLVKRALEQAASDRRSLLWLLLACYAHLNDVLQPVTNEHELAFQRRVVEWFESGSVPDF